MYLLEIRTIDDEVKVISNGNDPNKLAREFCKTEIIPVALSQGVDTKKKVARLAEQENWKEILQVYMGNPADMFLSPEALKIHDPKTNDIFFEIDLG